MVVPPTLPSSSSQEPFRREGGSTPYLCEMAPLSAPYTECNVSNYQGRSNPIGHRQHGAVVCLDTRDHVGRRRVAYPLSPFFASVISDKLNLKSYIILKLIRDLKVHRDHEFATGAKKDLTLFMHEVQMHTQSMNIFSGGSFLWERAIRKIYF